MGHGEGYYPALRMVRANIRFWNFRADAGFFSLTLGNVPIHDPFNLPGYNGCDSLPAMPVALLLWNS